MKAMVVAFCPPLSLCNPATPCSNQLKRFSALQIVLAYQASATPPSAAAAAGTIGRRSTLSLLALTTALSGFILWSTDTSTCWSKPTNQEFVELPNSGGVKALDLRIGGGEVPVNGDKVAIHYYGRLAAKQGWRFDSTYEHKDRTGDAIPFEFILGSGKVISGIGSAVRSMKVGGIRRVIIPPSEGYQSTSPNAYPAPTTTTTTTPRCGGRDEAKNLSSKKMSCNCFLVCFKSPGNLACKKYGSVR